MKVQLGPELTRTPNSANNSVAGQPSRILCKSSGAVGTGRSAVSATATVSEFSDSWPSTGYSAESLPKPPEHTEAARLPLTDFRRIPGPQINVSLLRISE